MTLLWDPRESDAPPSAVDRARLGGSSRPSSAVGDEAIADGALIDAVRAGDVGAYALLYQRHADAVRRLARRLCRDRYEADDVVSDVFANTLRAIQNGGGPQDDFAAYALRSVRNTVSKLRTRTDTARATPVDLDTLDQPEPDEPYRLTGDIEQAFAELPAQFQQVLWTTAIEGRTPAEVAAGAGLDAGGVASLSHRARKALGRSYLRVHTHRPVRNPECKRVRGYLPGYVQHTAGAGTAQRIEAHLAHCLDCAQVRDEMRDLNGKLRTTPWLALFAAAVRRAVMTVASGGVPAATAAAAPVVAVVVAGTVLTHDTTPSEPDRAAIAAAVFESADVLEPATMTAVAPTVAGTVDAPAPPPSPTPTALPTTDPPPDQIGVLPPNVVIDPVDVTAGPTGIDPLPPAATAPVPATTSVPTTTRATPPPVATPGSGGVPGGTGGAGPVATDPGGTTGGAGPGGVVGGAVDGVTTDVVPALGAGVGTLLDDVGNTVNDLTEVLGALPNGLPAVLDETGQLVAGVGTTLNNTLGTVGAVTNSTGQTLNTTVANLGATVDQTVTDLGEVLTIDPNDPVGDLVNDLAGPGGLLDNVVGGLLGGPTTTVPGAPAPACPPLLGLLC